MIICCTGSPKTLFLYVHWFCHCLSLLNSLVCCFWSPIPNAYSSTKQIFLTCFKVLGLCELIWQHASSPLEPKMPKPNRKMIHENSLKVHTTFLLLVPVLRLQLLPLVSPQVEIKSLWYLIFVSDPELSLLIPSKNYWIYAEFTSFWESNLLEQRIIIWSHQQQWCSCWCWSCLCFGKIGTSVTIIYIQHPSDECTPK